MTSINDPYDNMSFTGIVLFFSYPVAIARNDTVYYMLIKLGGTFLMNERRVSRHII